MLLLLELVTVPADGNIFPLKLLHVMSVLGSLRLELAVVDVVWRGVPEVLAVPMANPEKIPDDRSIPMLPNAGAVLLGVGVETG